MTQSIQPPTQPIDGQRLALILNDLRLPAVKQVWPEIAARSDREGWPATRFLASLAERFFADLTGDVIRAGSFTSVNELVRDIKAHLAARNADPKPYVWRAAGAEILAKIKRARAPLAEAAAM